MKNKKRLMILSLLLLVLGVILISKVDYKIAIGVWLMIFGNNIELSINKKKL